MNQNQQSAIGVYQPDIGVYQPIGKPKTKTPIDYERLWYCLGDPTRPAAAGTYN